MTTNYLESRCPIVSRCVRQLKGMVATVSFDDESDQLVSIVQALEAASADPSYVRLRGFVAVEKLMHLFDWAYTHAYKRHTPKLEGRSWQGLTRLHQQLEPIIDLTTLDITEHELAGVRVTTQNVVVLPKPMMEVGLVDFTHRVTAVRRVNTLAESVDHCVCVLRPYLRNENTSVGSIGDELAKCHMELYGMLATSYFMQTIRELLDVKL